MGIDGIMESDHSDSIVADSELIDGPTHSSEFLQLLRGVNTPCLFEYPLSPPPWLDTELYDIGIKYYHKNMLGIMASNGEALIMGLALPTFYKPLAFSGVTSRDPRAAIMRYMHTGKHIYGRWYAGGNPWEKGSNAAESLKLVNKMHKHVADMIRADHENFDKQVESEFVDCRVEGKQADILREELFELKKNYPPYEEYDAYISCSQSFSQFDMTLVQAAFFAAILIYPEHYGARSASVLELEGFVHVWRVFGYYLGISEANNAASFDLKKTIVVGREVMEKILKPCMLNVNIQSMMMAQKIFSDPLNYYVWVYRNYRMVGFNLQKLWNSFTWKQCYVYYARSFFLGILYPCQFVRCCLNYWANKIIVKMWGRSSMVHK